MADENKMVSAESDTIQKFISNFRREAFTYQSFFLKNVNAADAVSRYIYNDRSILDIYRNELSDIVVKLELSTAEYYKYRYNPKRLSYDLYGTTELWFLLLDLNEMYSMIEFDSRVLKVYNTQIYSILSDILTNEKVIIDYNEEAMKEYKD